MAPSTFSDILRFVMAHGYFIFYIGALLEGVLITTAAGVASALGYFNIYIIMLLSVLGDLSGDLIFYAIGYYGRGAFLDRYGKYIGLSKSRMENVSSLLHKNFNKAMIVIKLSPIVSAPGIVFVGASRAPLKKFIKLSLLVSLPRSILFALIGFYAGAEYEHVTTTVKHAEYVIWGVVLIVIVAYIVYQKLTSDIYKNMEKNSK